MKKIRSKHDDDEDIYSELDKNQWSSAWLSVMRSLRSGVTLNRVEHHHKVPVQFELSPYEMLLDDIRKKKYSLKEAPEFPEYLRKDTHDIILDFIRSRPPLNPVSLNFANLLPIKKGIRFMPHNLCRSRYCLEELTYLGR